MKWMQHAHESFEMLLENMVAEAMLAKSVGVDATPHAIVGASLEALLEAARVSFPLAKIMDESDLVLRAAGPGVREDSLVLSSVNWVTHSIEQAIRSLSGSLFQLADRDAKKLARSLDLRLTGFAPGSLYAGVRVAAPTGDLLPAEDEAVIASIRAALLSMPAATEEIGEYAINPAIRDIIPDPGRRDATLAALLRLAPTGRKRVHTMELVSAGHPHATLGQRERAVLQEAIRRPQMTDVKKGSFVGELREVDLDSKRFHLRHVEAVGGLRCVMGQLDPALAKRMLGEFVRVFGDYETDASGRPRLMIVDRADVLPRADQPPLMS